MKAKASEYLEKVRPAAKKLIEILQDKYEYCSLLGADSYSVNYSVSASGINVSENPIWSTRGFVARVFDKLGEAEYSFDELSEDNIPLIVEGIERAVKAFGGKSVSEGVPKDKPLFINESTELEIDPEELGTEKIISKLSEIREKGLSKDKKIIDCQVMFFYYKTSNIFISKNRDLTQNLMSSAFYAAAIASDGKRMEQGFKSCSASGGAEVLKNLEAKMDEAADLALDLLESTPIIPGEYECVCTPDVTGMIVHEAFGHGVEMDMFVKDRALAKHYIGKRVASPLVTMHDSACAVKETATYFFDDEGEEAHDTLVIDKGILKTGYCDAKSALSLDVSPTGNGRRESFERKAYTRMTNTYFLSGESTVEEMIASIKYGFLISDPSSGMEDPKNWGIQAMVSVAREIKDGKLTGKIFSPIVLTGYVPDLLKSVSMVSGDFELNGSGVCGKGHKEWVKVSDGGPYIKAKISLG